MALTDQLLSAAGDIARSPFVQFEVLWLLIPLFLLWLILTVYFDIHRGEKLGWNTALGNGITLFWISADVMRALFAGRPGGFGVRITINVIVLFYAVLIIYSSFAHKLPEKWNFLMASPTVVYYIAGATILWGYGSLPFNRFVAIDLVILFIIVLLFKGVLRLLLRKKAVTEAPEIGAEIGAPPPELGPVGKGTGGDLPPLPKI